MAAYTWSNEYANLHLWVWDILVVCVSVVVVYECKQVSGVSEKISPQRPWWVNHTGCGAAAVNCVDRVLKKQNI